jgi:hypothetical protein
MIIALLAVEADRMAAETPETAPDDKVSDWGASP